MALCRNAVFRSAICAGTALWVIGLTATTATAQAGPGQGEQVAAGEEAEGTIIVTGTRIQRRDYDSESPIVTVSREILDRASDIGIDQALNELPQFRGGQNQLTSATDVQVTPTRSPGIATINLRGLGENRTLVLLDGRRTQPANANLVVDLNTIPMAALEGVEIITGGAGATYGADAVAGVVNFTLRRNFEGVEIDTQWGQTFRGDGQQFRTSALLGGNLDGGRGNVMLALTYQSRGEVRMRDRPFIAAALTDPNTPGRNVWPNFGLWSGTAPQSAYDAIFVPRGYAPGDVRPGQQLLFNTAPTVDQATLFAVAPGRVSGRPAPGFTGPLYPNNKLLANGTLASESEAGFLSAPLERFSAFAKGHYEVSDGIEVYAQASFDQNTMTTEQLGWTPSFNQWGVTVPRGPSHPVPPQLATILDARTDPNARWNFFKQLDYLGNRQTNTVTSTYELLAGVRGDVGVRDWTFDVFASTGRTFATTGFSGFADVSRYQRLINMPNYGANSRFEDGRTGMLATCTSGLNPFLDRPVSQDCIDIISAPINTITDISQNQVEATMQGSLANLPAGDLRFAGGATYRDNSLRFRPDASISTTNISSITLGQFMTSPASGTISVWELFGELLIPVVSDKPFFENLSLNLGARYSEFNTAGGVWTMKANAMWDMTDWLSLRGGYQIANRAPNIAELFQPPVFVIVPWPDHDPCSQFTRASWGNVPDNPNRAQVLNLCSQLADGFPIPQDFTGNVPTYFPLGRDLQRGNRNLRNEESHTITLGAVVSSPFDTAVLERLRLSVDYYDITVNGAISPASTPLIYQECFNVLGNNPTLDPNNEFCQRINRDPTNGWWISAVAPFENFGRFSTAGFDVQADWSIDAPGIGNSAGNVFANVLFNYLTRYDVQNAPGGPIFDFAGSVGAPIFAPPFGAQPRWDLSATLGYEFGPAMLSVNWRHTPGMRNFALVTNPAARELPTAAYNIFDLAAAGKVNDRINWRAGIDNLFDVAPPIFGRIPGVTDAVGALEPSGAFDLLGRRFFIGFTAAI